MSTEWKLQQAISALRGGIANMQAEDPEAVIDIETEFPETVEEVEAAIRKIVARAQDAEDMADAARKRATEAGERARRFETRGKRYRGVIMGAMDAMNWRKKEFPEATVSLRAPQEGVEIIDETELPQGFVKVTRSPDKSAIRTALKAGETVPGAVLTPGLPGLMIRSN